MTLRTAQPQSEAGTEPLATRAPAARAPLPVVEQPSPRGNLPPLAALRRASLLQLQRAAGNAAVAGSVAALTGASAASVQRCGSIPPNECPCRAEDASAEVEPATPAAHRQATGAATVQRAQTAAGSAPVVQRTTVGPILDEYFSPFSSPQVWVMEETDPYTVLVRGWQPVIDGQAWLLTHLEQNATDWAARHRTTPGWRPGTTGHDPAAASNPVNNPPGTDPTTCSNAFLPYLAGEAARRNPWQPLPLPRIETWELHTCAIGSFVLRATVDAIDQAAGTATVNIWMQNEMSRKSFGQFAKLAVLSGQATQYMWWHWRVQHRWVPAPPPPPPPPPLPTLTGDLLFDFDSATVRPEARSALAATLPALRARPSTNIVGHTDSRGTDEYNQRLSERRAHAVVAVLVAADASLAGRLHASGRGESEPVDTNDTPAGRKRNRRVELVSTP
ncbi:OmpA family protein [Amycolatopsis sp. NPDC049688]|uniref:OmpA family protein n=1 Tax=Amycolatopsis sp. NPDC049688 TaxID=3154733 RepID=UPI0034270727